MATSGVKQKSPDKPAKLIRAVISEVKRALFPDVPHKWLDHFSRNLKALTEEPETSDRRLWWTLHGQEIGSATDVESAIRYLVLGMQPGLEEFRGIYIYGGLGPEETAKRVCRSLRVPKQRGAVNWMTDCIRGLEEIAQKEGRERREVLALFDAWMDLRGHAASEDLILGNRSVAGFPLYLPGHETLAGYFFISHPMPGLFYEEENENQIPIESFTETLRGLRERYEEPLAMAVDLDLFTEFTFRPRPDGSARSLPGTIRPTAEPLIDLSADDPSGYVATVFLPTGSSLPESAINEGAFSRQLWSYASLLSFLPDDWQVLTASMEAYSRNFEKSPGCFMPFWDPQEQSENEEQRWRSVDMYYPKNQDLSFVPEVKESPNVINSPLHQRFETFRSLYSSSHDPRRLRYPQADLVIPLGCRSLGMKEPPRIAGFIRLNCDSSKGDATQYQEMYRLIADQHVQAINDSLGRLLVLADSDLRRIHERQNASLFKQAYDTVRQLADWSAKCLAARGTLIAEKNSKNEPTAAPFSESLLQRAMRNVWKRLEQEGCEILVNEADRSDLLKDSIKAIHKLATALSGVTEIPLTLVTFWLRVWTPTVRSLPENSNEFVDLIMRDPGLMDVLQHLVLIKEPVDKEFCKPTMREVVHGRSVIDLGYPHHAQLTSLHVQSKPPDSTSISWTTANTHSISLKWNTPQGFAAPARLIPAALAIMDGRVSDRIARSIAESGLIKVPRNYSKPTDCLSLEETMTLVEGGTPRWIRSLQDLFFHPNSETSGPWTVLPLRAFENDPATAAHLCVLAPDADHGRPIVMAARNLSISEAIGKYRALRIAAARKFIRDQASIDHHLIGPAEQLVPALMTVKAVLGRTGRPTESPEVRFETARRNAHDAEQKLTLLGDKVAKMELLARDSIYFSNGRCTPNLMTGDDFFQHVSEVIGTHDDPFKPFIENTVKPTAFAKASAIYDFRVFRHALGNLVRNAVKHRSPPTSTVVVSAERRGDDCHLQIANHVTDAESVMKNIESARHGMGSEHGVNESYRSLEELLKLKLRYIIHGDILTAEVLIPLFWK